MVILIRAILTLALVIGICMEAGPLTGLFAALVALVIEVQTAALRNVIRSLRRGGESDD